jgi:guanylate kinase
MNETRLQAYKNARAKLDDFKGIKLTTEEYARLEGAVEGRLLSNEKKETDTLLHEADRELQKLVEADRWIPDTAEKLLEQIRQAGPSAEEAVPLK